MTYLSGDQADRIITDDEFNTLAGTVNANDMAIRCNQGTTYHGGDGYNLAPGSMNRIRYATALYASICFAQDTIHDSMDNYSLLLMRECALGAGDTYNYRQGDDIYRTLPKCHGLGGAAVVVRDWNMNDSAINLSRKLVEAILAF